MNINVIVAEIVLSNWFLIPKMKKILPAVNAVVKKQKKLYPRSHALARGGNPASPVAHQTMDFHEQTDRCDRVSYKKRDSLKVNPCILFKRI